MGTIKCIGILTSGGDAPGMNAAIRAVTRAAIYNGLQVKGIYRGYKGLVTGEIKEFKSQNVSNIIQLGGTILKTARCKEFTTPEGRQIAYDNMKKEGIDALVVIGGDGSLTGARIFAQEFDVPCIGLPGTIDNDLYGTDTTIGYDTALNTILGAVDKIRDTATSHERLFFVEVMGRDAGFLALNGAIASGAEAAIIPEFSTEVDQLEEFIKNGFRKSKNSSIVLVAESELTGGAMHYAERVKNEYPQYDVRVTILGHLQRGGSPTAHDRILASRLGAAAVDAIMEGQRNVRTVPQLLHLHMVGELSGKRFRTATYIQSTRTFSRILIQQQMNSRCGPFPGSTDERTEKNIRQRVEPHVHRYDIGGNNARVSRINHNTFFFKTGSQIKSKQSQRQFRITVHRNTPEASFPSPKKEIGKVETSDSIGTRYHINDTASLSHQRKKLACQ